ncbi:MAG: 2-amino-4-hydroxy-6-hydroxymethyldihydropteridine diphosphokinase [Actinomycetota bacterium]|nr:2-amino-4-hydroxy-6-hydroxymethyldihydropteridine diphosphokinase [Actinomycetota bacterium]
MRVHLALGSNLGDREAFLVGAVSGLRAVDPGLAVSPLYETAPVGGPEGQGPYLNCVVRMDVVLDPREVLELARSLENAAGRTREARFGPRTLDVDVLLVEGVEQDDPELVLPHPRMLGRAFVLAPLEDLDPGLVPAGWREALGGSAAVDAAVRRVRGAL